MATGAIEPKRGAEVGRVVVAVGVENYGDFERAERGEIAADRIRRTQVDALVDSGATCLCVPKAVVEELGLRFLRSKEARTVAGPMKLGVCGAARVSVQGRDCITEMMALPDDRLPLLGPIPLELMDWRIDLDNQRLVGNPEHGGQWMAEAY